MPNTVTAPYPTADLLRYYEIFSVISQTRREATAVKVMWVLPYSFCLLFGYSLTDSFNSTNNFIFLIRVVRLLYS
jgi:hypothetical protein